MRAAIQRMTDQERGEMSPYGTGATGGDSRYAGAAPLMKKHMAIDATLARLEREVLIDAAPAIYAILGRPHFTAAPAPAPVVMPEPASPPALLPVSRAAAPDGLRQRLGLH